MVGNIIFDGISAISCGAIITENESFASPERDYSVVEIPGKNGELVIDNGRYKNVDIKVGMFFWDRRMLSAYKNKMLGKIGYNRLEFSFNPDEFRIAKINGGAYPEMCGIRERHGQLEITFSCKPQRFLKSGEEPVEFTSSSTRALYNPGGQPAKPLIRVYGSGTLGIGGSTVMIDEHGRDYLDIDCDIQDCFHETENLNKYMRGDFPVLGEGTIGISLGDGITKIIVWPRWWRL